MDYRKALENLERLLSLIEREVRSEPLSDEEQAQVPMLYGVCEPVITQIVGIQQVSVPVHGNLMANYPNLIEAGFLSSRTIHRHEGLQQLRKVVGRVRQLAEDPGVPQAAASISQLLQVLNRFRQCCQYVVAAPQNERAVQDIIWIMLRSQFDRVEREEQLPTFGVKSYRPDFGVPELATLIEVKYVGDTTRPADVQEQFLSDVPGYLTSAPMYTSLVAFVYDAANKFRDPRRFMEDLRRVDGVIDVIVIPGL